MHYAVCKVVQSPEGKLLVMDFFSENFNHVMGYSEPVSEFAVFAMLVQFSEDMDLLDLQTLFLCSVERYNEIKSSTLGRRRSVLDRFVCVN